MPDSFTQHGSTHCVFRRGSTWFALPAEEVREVCERPALVTIPGSSEVLAGMCHVRSEFTPVIRLNRLMPESQQSLGDEAQLIVVENGDGAWGILADEVRALVPLEPSSGDEVNDIESWTSAIMGWAAWSSESVRVLHSGHLRDLVEKELGRSWGASDSALIPVPAASL